MRLVVELGNLFNEAFGTDEHAHLATPRQRELRVNGSRCVLDAACSIERLDSRGQEVAMDRSNHAQPGEQDQQQDGCRDDGEHAPEVAGDESEESW